MSIPECGIYLAPLAPKRSFYVAPPLLYGDQKVPYFDESSCSVRCWEGEHYMLELLLGE